MNLWIFFHFCLLKTTSQPQPSSALRADLMKRALFLYFRWTVLLVIFLVISVLSVYPLVLLHEYCWIGIVCAQMFAGIPLDVFNRVLRGRYFVIAGLTDAEVLAGTKDAKVLTTRFREAGLRGI